MAYSSTWHILNQMHFFKIWCFFTFSFWMLQDPSLHSHLEVAFPFSSQERAAQLHIVTAIFYFLIRLLSRFVCFILVPFPSFLFMSAFHNSFIATSSRHWNVAIIIWITFVIFFIILSQWLQVRQFFLQCPLSLSQLLLFFYIESLIILFYRAESF